MRRRVAETAREAKRLVAHWSETGRLEVTVTGMGGTMPQPCLVETLAGDVLRRLSLRPDGHRRWTGCTEIRPTYGAVWIAVPGVGAPGIVVIAPPIAGHAGVDRLWS